MVLDAPKGFAKKDFAVLDNGKITFKNIPDRGAIEIDISGSYVIPSLFDLHTHIRCPGQEYKEDFEHVTRAAVAGGFTELCSMPNTKPVADNEAIIDYIILEGERYGRCRIHPFGSLTVGLQGEKLARMGLMKNKGAVGVTDDGMCIQDTSLMMKAMEYAHTFGLFIMDHAEDNYLKKGGFLNEGLVADKLGLKGIPEISETIIIKRDIEISRYLNIPVHITHVSSKRGAELIMNAKKEGVKITFDITPHHLSFNEEACLGFNTNFKINPPLRTEKDRKFLIGLVREGKVDCLATDHAPHAKFEKEYPFDGAPFGVSNLDTALSLLYETLTIKEKIPFEKWVGLFGNAPRKLLKMQEKALKENAVANFAVFDKNLEWKVTEKTLYSKGKNTPLLGRKLKGKVSFTFYEGARVYPFGEK